MLDVSKATSTWARPTWLGPELRGKLQLETAVLVGSTVLLVTVLENSAI